MNRRTLNLLVVAMAIVTITAAAMLAFAVAQDKLPAPSMEEHMVSDTDAVLGVLRTWHNQISQDQAIIKAQAQRIDAIAKVRGEAGRSLEWNAKEATWNWGLPSTAGSSPTVENPAAPAEKPADKPVEAPGK